jgi:TetR/AcrR family transcriptional regulator
MKCCSSTRTQCERADQTRARILEAAVRQFSNLGLAGARTEQIAEEAGVNKAMLYYYFKGKDDLYTAALEHVGEGVRVAGMAALDGDSSAGERCLRSVLNHFDRLCTNRGFQSLMQQEMIRLHRGEANACSPLVEKVFRPWVNRVLEVLQEGIEAGELVPVEPMQIHYAALGSNVMYFLSAPWMQMILGYDPLEPAALAHRRQTSIAFLGQAIFIDRAHGARVAARVLASTPMPEISGVRPLEAPEFRAPQTDEVRHK